MAATKHRRGYWTLKRSLLEAKKYQYRSDFKKQANRPYELLKKHGLLDEACKHMSKKECVKKWTKEKCIQAAKECKTKSVFAAKYNGAYVLSRHRGWMEEISQYFTPVGSKYDRCIYACEFSDNYVYVGLTYNLERRKAEHLRNSDSAVYKHIQETGIEPTFKQITEYIDFRDASKKEGIILQEYKKKGWMSLNKCPTGGLGGNTIFDDKTLTTEICVNRGRKYKSLNMFKKHCPLFYEYLEKNNELDELTTYYNSLPKYTPPHTITKELAIKICQQYDTIKEFSSKHPYIYAFMLKNNLQKEIRQGKRILQRDKWTFEDAKNEALKYKSKKEFKENANGCYQVSLRRGWISEICQHMSQNKKEKYNENIAKEILFNFSRMEELKKNDDVSIRGLYWWMKSKNKIIEYKKYLKGNPLQSKRVSWTNELILNDLRKYSTYTEYCKKGRSLSYAKLHKLINVIKKYYQDGTIWF